MNTGRALKDSVAKQDQNEQTCDEYISRGVTFILLIILINS